MRKGAERVEIHVSVRQLVEFILREGDIDNRRTGGSDTAMQEGGRIHRMLQRRMGSDYHPEVTLRYVWRTEEYDVVLEGRADGIIDLLWSERAEAKQADVLIEESELSADAMERMTDEVIIDEIKGTYRDLRRITKPVGVHLAQAKCYAYIYASQNRLSSIGVRMTYCNMETEELRYFHESYTIEELTGWFGALMQEYKKWTDFQFAWSKKRTDSIKQLSFPFPYREGQKELVTYVYQTIYHRRKLFLEAPTGVGKTISTVFPAVKAMGEGLAEKIFYLTAKTITRTVATDCFSLLSEHGLAFKTLVITAKDKICPMEETDCNPEYCPFAKGHFDRINDAMYELLQTQEHFSRETVLDCAKKHQVCPFEMSLDMSLYADAVICDYNYVFDPNVYLKRFFADGAGAKDYIFLIDEAHNLLERGRQMYSAALYKEDFLKMKKLVKELNPKLERQLEKCNRELLSLKRECVDYRKEELIAPFVIALTRAYATLDEFLEEHDTFPQRGELLDFYFEMAHFLNIYEIMDDNYIAYSQQVQEGEFMLKLFCMNPSANLRNCMYRGRSTILFSATFLPIQYYKKLLGGEEQDYEVYAKSTFDEEKKALLLASDVTSRYTRRSSEEYERIARYIFEVVRQRYGNYMVFFPSHAFLEEVCGCFMESYYDETYMECVFQEEYMSEQMREDFLNRFVGNESCNLQAKISFEIEEEDEKLLLGFCVMGGIFSEGIDLKRDSLIGTIIVGTGLPQVCCERELLKEYFDAQGENGFDYAYRIPGMNKVLQSAGRVIRTVEDVGIVALLDERFMTYPYRRMFPREWSRYEVVNVEEVSKRVEKFWNDWL